MRREGGDVEEGVKEGCEGSVIWRKGEGDGRGDGGMGLEGGLLGFVLLICDEMGDLVGRWKGDIYLYVVCRVGLV